MIIEVETYGVIEKIPVVPSVIVLADLVAGSGSQDKDFGYLHQCHDVDALLRSISPPLDLQVPDMIHGTSARVQVQLEFRSLADFHPDAIAWRAPEWKACLRRRWGLHGLVTVLDGNPDLESQLRALIAPKRDDLPQDEHAQALLIRQILDELRTGDEDIDQEAAEQRLWALRTEHDEQPLEHTGRLIKSLNQRISALDARLSRQVSQVLHHPDFQCLEAAWRGLHYLMTRLPEVPGLRVYVVNIAKSALAQALTTTSGGPRAWYQDTIRPRLSPQEVPCLLVGDYLFDCSDADVALLQAIAELGAQEHVPFVAAAGPAFFSMEGYEELPYPRDLSNIFETHEYERWRDFRRDYRSGHIALCLPQMLMRPPYGPDTVPARAFDFVEIVESHEDAKHLWGNCAYDLALRVIQGLRHWGLPLPIIGAGSVERLSPLPTYSYITSEGLARIKCPLALGLSNALERKLSSLGFTPMVHRRNSGYATFQTVGSFHLAPRFDPHTKPETSPHWARWEAVLIACHFAGALTALFKLCAPEDDSAETAELRANQWLAPFVSDEGATAFVDGLRYPFRLAQVSIAEVQSSSSHFAATLTLLPWYASPEDAVAMELPLRLPRKSPSSRGRR